MKSSQQVETAIYTKDQSGPFYAAENYHQEYLKMNPGGYCNHGYRMDEW